MSKITRFETGSRMSQAVRYNGIVSLAGQVGEAGADVATQTKQALAEIERILEQNNSSKARILQITIWLANMADFDAMNTVYDAWVDLAHAPTRATCEARLAAPEYRVEILAIAAENE